MAERKPLPGGWKWATLKEVGQMVRGVSYRKEDSSEQPLKDTVPILRATNIQEEQLIIDRNLVYVPSKYIKTEQYLKPGDIVVCMSSGSKKLVGKTAQLTQEWKGSFGTFCATIRPHPNVHSRFVSYFFSSPKYRKFIRDKSAGININNLKPSDFETLEIPLPPLSEQKSIVAKIEELFTQLDAGTAALRGVQAKLKRYKASVLKAACEGRLVEQDPEDEPAEELLRRINMSPLINQRLSSLPEKWCWTIIDDISSTIGGVTKGRNLRGKPTVKLPYLRVANVQRGYLELDKMKEIEVLASEVEKYRLRFGDVVLTEGGDWDKLGRSAVWKNQIPNCIHQNHIFRARVNESVILPEYLMYYTNSVLGQTYFKDAAKQTTNLASINLTQLRSCLIPLPPLSEQRRIVAEVERRLSVAAEVEAAVEAVLTRSDRLRQSILERAFEGRLVGPSTNKERINEWDDGAALEQAVADQSKKVEKTLKQARLF